MRMRDVKYYRRLIPMIGNSAYRLPGLKPKLNRACNHWRPARGLQANTVEHFQRQNRFLTITSGVTLRRR